MMLIHAGKKSNRLRYILDQLFNELIATEYELTSDAEAYAAYPGPKMHYGKERMDDSLFMRAESLLFEEGLGHQEPLVFDYEGGRAIFQTPSSDWPFDLFAASFFFLSRYEEYLPFIRDEHGRFPAAQSLAYKNGFLQLPVVDIWAGDFKDFLKKKFPSLHFKEKKYRFTPTFDIDIAWSYLHKGVLRNFGGFVKAALTGNVKDFYYRAATLLRIKPDPYFTYDYLRALQQRYGLKPLYFILLGDFDEYDKNIAYTEPAFRVLIKHLEDIARVGLHPSYASNQQTDKLEKEKHRLEEIIHRKVDDSRQHYLMLEFPVTYERLLAMGIRNDYTLGYTTHMGFRAGTCTPFYFYNLQLEQKTDLRLHPFALMDANFRYYMDIAPSEVLAKAGPVVDAVRNVNGTLYTLWHNNSFSEVFEWKGWRAAFEDIVKYAIPEKNN